MANIMKRNNSNSGLATTELSFGGLVDNILQQSLSHFFNDEDWGFTGVRSRVPVNIRETNNSYELEVMAPGVKKEGFNVSMDNNMLTISFEHHENKEENRDDYLHREYAMQSFARSFNLDDTVDADKVSAQYRDGVLHVSLPKKEGAQRITKNIEIK